MRKIIILITFLTFFSCGDNGIEGYVNESINISAKNDNDEELDVDYYWTLANQPDGSLLNTNDLIPNSDGKSMAFTPDYPGDYTVEVIISQYGDEISSQIFSFLILDPSNRSDKKEIDKTTNENWLDEELDDIIVEENISKVIKEEQVDDIIVEENINKSIKQEQVDEVVAEKNNNKKLEERFDKVIEKETNYTPQITKISTKEFHNEKQTSSLNARVDRFTIQITSKRMLRDAQLFSQKMISKGYDSYIQKAIFKTDQTWYRVRVGSYDNYNSAKVAADALSGELGMKTWVDLVRKEQEE